MSMGSLLTRRHSPPRNDCGDRTGTGSDHETLVDVEIEPKESTIVCSRDDANLNTNQLMASSSNTSPSKGRHLRSNSIVQSRSCCQNDAQGTVKSNHCIMSMKKVLPVLTIFILFFITRNYLIEQETQSVTSNNNNNLATVTANTSSNLQTNTDVITDNSSDPIPEPLARWQQREILNEFLSKIQPKTAIPNNNHKEKQQMVILAGPHYTNAEEIQKKFWMWTTYNQTQNFTKPILNNWVWPAPMPIVHAEFAEMDEVDWTPADIYYPLFEAIKTVVVKEMIKKEELFISNPRLPSRLLFQKYELKNIFKMIQEDMEEHLELGYNLVFGTDAFNHIVTFPEIQQNFIETIQQNIIPKSITGDQITVVILYQTPKLDRYISLWRKTNEPTFRDWLDQTGALSFSSCKELGIAQAILENTNWNVALIDTKGLEEDNNWDISNYIACHVMKANCDNHGLIGFDDEKDGLTTLPPTLPRQTIFGEAAWTKINEVFMSFDCKFRKSIQKYAQENGRFKVYHSSGFMKTMKHCEKMNTKFSFDLDEMKSKLMTIVKRNEIQK